MSLVQELVEDLRRESAAIDELVADLDDAGWDTPTAAEPWTVADTIGHLLWTDRVALVAARQPASFEDVVAVEVSDGDGDAVTRLARQTGDLPRDELLAAWRLDRELLARALVRHPEGGKLPWFGPPMSAASMATARLMETWAHGHDVAEALGVDRETTVRLRHVCHLAVRTRDFSFTVHGRAVPDREVRVELLAPDGATWTWGDQGALDRVTGTARDFCLLAVQRIHRDDTALVATGPVADAWLDVIQAFAGPPGRKRPSNRTT